MTVMVMFMIEDSVNICLDKEVKREMKDKAI